MSRPYHETPVVEFHHAFGVPVHEQPRIPHAGRRKLRLNLILEELLELAAASGFKITVSSGGKVIRFEEAGDNLGVSLVEAADAITDLRYVVDGASLEWGIPLERCLAEVHRSNMSKLGVDGKPLLREDGKVLKGPNYSPPDLARVLFGEPA